MNSELFEQARRVLRSYLQGETPEPDAIRALNEQARHAQPLPPPVSRPAEVAAAALDADVLTGADDTQLDALFRSSGTLGIERIINSGVRRVDPVGQEIYNDAYWKGYLPKGLPLGEVASQIYTGYYKRFWRAADGYVGETRYLDGRVPLNHTLEEIVLDRDSNDLAPGRYILLRYADPVFEHLFYDVMKIITADVVLYRGYVGRFPDGTRGWTAPLLRRYKFPQMDVQDHSNLFTGAPPATPADLVGTWRLDIVANSNHAVNVAQLRIESAPDGSLRTLCEAGQAFAGAPLSIVTLEHFRVDDFRRLLGEIRELGRDVRIGRWLTSLPTNLSHSDAGSMGLFQAVEESGESRLVLDYVLYRTR